MKNKNTFIFLFIIFSLILVFATGCYNEPKMGKIVGQVAYLDYTTNNKGYPDDHIYCVYLLPSGQEDSGIWVPFTVTIETETESKFSTTPSEMQELTIGNTVEIEYYTEEIIDAWALPGYEACSIKTVSDANYENELPFTINEDYIFERGGEQKEANTGKVVHVARVDELDGYIIYLDETSYGVRTLAMYWIDKGTMLDDETKANIESRTTGYWVRVIPLVRYPFDNLSVAAVPFVEKIER